MQLPIRLRRSLARFVLVCAALLATGLLSPVYSTASQTGAPTEKQVTREEEQTARRQERAAREQQRAEDRAAREREREALETKHEEEQAARRNARNSRQKESGAGGQAGEDPSSEPNTDASAKALHGCQLSIESSSQRITAGESVTLTGALTCPAETSTTDQTDTDGQTSTAEQTIAAGQQVTLYVRQLGAGAQVQQNLAPPGAVSTAANGSYELTSPILDKTSILLVRVGTHHARLVVKVAPLITLSTPATSSLQASSASVQPQDTQPPQSGTSTTLTTTTPTPLTTVSATEVTFSGTVSPAVEGERVTLQIAYPTATDEHWQTVAYGRVGTDGSYSIAHAFHHPGKVNVRAVAHPHGPDVKGTSAPVAYEVLESSPTGLASQLTTPVAPANA